MSIKLQLSSHIKRQKNFYYFVLHKKINKGQKKYQTGNIMGLNTVISSWKKILFGLKLRLAN